jgi:signal transduction histidine kinase
VTDPETQHVVARLEALDEAARAIAGVLDVEAVLQLIVDRVRSLVDAEYAALGIADSQGTIERFITSGMSSEQRAAIGDLPRGRGLLGLIIHEGRSYRISDIAAHPDSVGFPSHHPKMTAFLGVPIVIKGKAIGNLYLTDKRGGVEFTEADQELVELFARHAGIAIDNARLHAQVQRLAVTGERDRIGRDLHDGIIQDLYAVSLSLEDVESMIADHPDEAVARVDRAIDSIHVAIRDIRSFILGLRPHLLQRGDLVGGLSALADEVRLTTLIDVEMTVDGEETLEGLDLTIRTELLHIAREAISNVVRHSHATAATIAFVVEDASVRLEIADNGRGFVNLGAQDDGHQGLANMRDRAGALGGRLDIEGGPGDGTRIIVSVPIRRGERPS